MGAGAARKVKTKAAETEGGKGHSMKLTKTAASRYDVRDGLTGDTFKTEDCRLYNKSAGLVFSPAV